MLSTCGFSSLPRNLSAQPAWPAPFELDTNLQNTHQLRSAATSSDMAVQCSYTCLDGARFELCQLSALLPIATYFEPFKRKGNDTCNGSEADALCFMCGPGLAYETEFEDCAYGAGSPLASYNTHDQF